MIGQFKRGEGRAKEVEQAAQRFAPVRLGPTTWLLETEFGADTVMNEISPAGTIDDGDWCMVMEWNQALCAGDVPQALQRLQRSP